MKKFLVALTLALVLALGCVVIASAAPTAVNEKAIVAYGDISSITEIAGHAVKKAGSVSELFAYQPSTCSEYGVAYFECAESDEVHPGDALHAVYIAKQPHNWKEVEKVAATCTKEGTVQLVCANCGEKGTLVTTKANGHRFTTKVKYFIEPTCTEFGYGYRVCDVCGEAETTKGPKDLKEAQAAGYTPTTVGDKTIKFNAEKKWVESNKTGHKYTDWKFSKYGDCYDYGKATKTCINCGDIQYVGGNSATQVVIKKKDGTIVEEKSIDEALKDDEEKAGLKDVLEGIKKFNMGYDDAYLILNGKEYPSYYELEKDVAKALKVASIELQSDVYKNCTKRVVTYVCPACKSLTKSFDPATAWTGKDGVHPAIKVTMNVETHVWKAKPESAESLGNKGIKEYVEKAAGIGLIETEGKGKELRDVYMGMGWVDANHSVAPNCVLPGFNLYLCEYDAKAQPDGTAAHGHDAETEYKVEYLYNTGHDWSDWKTVETYTLNGKNYKVQSHICNTCKVEEHETVEYTPDPALNGLVLVGDEFLYFVDDEWQDEFTGVVEYDGQKFYVVDGVVDGTKNGLTLIDGQFVYLIENRLATEVNQVVLYDGEWFKVVNGVLDTKMPAGLYDYDGGKFIFAAGRLINDYTGLWLNPLDNDWYYIKAGSGFDSSFTGETVYDGATFQVVNGKLAK